MSKIRSLFTITIMALGALTFSTPAGAQDGATLDRVVTSDTLRVGMSGNQPPFNMRGRSGQLMGLEVDLATILAAAMDVELEIVTRPFGELMGALAAGDVDMVVSGMAITPRRARSAAFVGPYMLSGKSILTNSTALAAADSADDINRRNLKLAALENSTSQEFIERYVPDAQLVSIQDYDAGVQMVLNDEVDALVADMPITLLSLLRYPDAGLATLDQPLTIEPIGIAVAASDHQFRSLVQNYIDTLEGTGILEALRAKWLEDGSWIAALP
jgi:polar amino acid transport system substrate-binding protein